MKFINLLIAATAASLVHARDIQKRSSGFTWFGVSESGAEFGETNIPGKLDKDYTWPNTTAIQTLRDDGMNIFRVPFLMERLVPSEMTGSLDQAYLKGLKKTVAFITGSGAYAVLDPHNYGRYSGNIISSTDNFQAFWKTVAGEFASNNKVIFDTNNEYHDMPQTLVQTLNQAAINGIRASGAKTQPIFIEGNSYTGAWKWTTENDNLKTLTDPSANLVYEMHQYLDSDGSGTAEECVSASIGRERMQKATQWLKTNGKKGFLGEFGGGVNAQCQEAVRGMLQYMQANSDVWMGAEWWAAGPWWGEEYMYNLEPTDGKAYAVYLPILKKFFPSPSPSSSSPSSSSSSPSSSGTASAAASTAQVIRSSSSPASSSGTGAGASGSTIPVHVPTTMATSAAASSSSATPVASSSSASLSSSDISSASTPAASSSGGVARRFA